MNRPKNPALMLLLLPLALAACQGATYGVLGASVAEGASVAVFGRGIIDIAYSLASGRDCSLARLEQRKTYCRPEEAPPSPPPYCTRSLGVVDCWANPAALTTHPPAVADGPSTLTAEQERHRTARWPGPLD
jgi:hypothetical protein